MQHTIHSAQLLRPDSCISIALSLIIPTNNLEHIPLLHNIIELLLINRRSHPMSRIERRARGFLPDRSVVISATNLVPTDESQSVSKADEIIELCLILRGCHPVTCDPGRCLRRLLPDCDVASFSSDFVAADMFQAVALPSVGVEVGLVLRRCHAMSCDPSTGW